MRILADINNIEDLTVAAVAGPLILAIIFGLFRWGRNVGRMLSTMSTHFTPPTDEELRAGAVDNTVPARLARLETKAEVAADKQDATSSELTLHLATEEKAAETMEVRLQSGDDRMGRMDERMGRMEEHQRSIEGKLDAVLQTHPATQS